MKTELYRTRGTGAYGDPLQTLCRIDGRVALVRTQRAVPHLEMWTTAAAFVDDDGAFVGVVDSFEEVITKTQRLARATHDLAVLDACDDWFSGPAAIARAAEDGQIVAVDGGISYDDAGNERAAVIAAEDPSRVTLDLRFTLAF